MGYGSEIEILPISPESSHGPTAIPSKMLSLNNSHAAELSWLDPGRLSYLLRAATYARRIGDVDAFMLAFDQDAPYDSPNFRWFVVRYSRFLYIDRIVVSPNGRRLGYGRRLYEDLIRYGLANGCERIVCEINLEPPNPTSEAFHAAFGFFEVGRGASYEKGKTVRYMARLIGARSPRD